MTIDLNLLWKLQQCETGAREISDLLTRMPRDLERAREEQGLREAALKAREAEHQEQMKTRRALEKQVEDYDAKLHANAMSQGKAKTNAELDAYKKEAAYLRDHKSGVETRILEMFEEEEAINARIAEAKTQVAQAKGAADEKARLIEERAAGDRAELERRRAEIDDLATGLPAGVRTRFDQLLKAKNGIAVAGVARGACGGCFNSIPPQFLNEIRKAESLQICESCGRILVWWENS